MATISEQTEACWIETYTGRFFNLAAPEPDQIDIADIAQGLSHCCRFHGQVNGFYSVAEHAHRGLPSDAQSRAASTLGLART